MRYRSVRTVCQYQSTRHIYAHTCGEEVLYSTREGILRCQTIIDGCMRVSNRGGAQKGSRAHRRRVH